jgi:lyso-ornithine lipid O-acyltransferase
MASLSIARTDRPHPRAWFRVALLALALLVLIVPHIVWRWFDKRSPFARAFLYLGGRIAGAQVRIVGTPVRKDVLFLANHVSWLDILVMSGATGCAFVAKADMAPWPVLGWLATSNNSVYVERENKRGATHQATALQTALLSGQPVTLFPEGTTAGGHELLPFRSSLIAAVVPAPEGISIQPVAIDYGALAAEIAWTDEESVGKNALRIMRRPGRLPVTLHFLKPLDHADFADRKAIALHSRQEIAEALGVAFRDERLF